MIHAAIFDMDGLLFDTERLYSDAWRIFASEAGYPVTEEQIHSFIGRNHQDTREMVGICFGPGFPYENFALKTRNWINDAMAVNGPPEKPGIRPVLEFLRAHSIPVALATSTSEKTARGMIERAGLTSFFSAFAFGCEVSRGKPDPEIFLLALKRLGTMECGSCAVFEDSPAGLAAAQAAGMKSVFVKDLVEPDSVILSRVWKRIDSLERAASLDFYSDMQ